MHININFMLDYIIVGCGLAGIAFSEVALENNKSILVFNNQSQNSSRIAGGLYNPVVLKRFSEVWKAKEQIQLLQQFYSNIEKKLNITINHSIPLFRKFYSVEEQNNWFIAADKPNLSSFLSTNLHFEKYNHINSEFGFGEVLHTGYVDVNLLLNSYQQFLKSINSYREETFDYSKIVFHNDYLEYNSIKTKHIVFAEGFGMISNPFFNTLPLDGTKGELLLIHAPNLKLENIINSSIFILPIGNDYYKVGATYNWVDKDAFPTENAKKELLNNLNELISCDYKVIDHYAGVRPTVKDRRPLVGTHPHYENIHLLNGMGTRGVMIAPAMAHDLFNYIENKIPLDKNCDIKRIKNYKG